MQFIQNVFPAMAAFEASRANHNTTRESAQDILGGRKTRRELQFPPCAAEYSHQRRALLAGGKRRQHAPNLDAVSLHFQLPCSSAVLLTQQPRAVFPVVSSP